MELAIRKGRESHAWFHRIAREEVTPVRGRPDPYFLELLLRWYQERAEDGADVSCSSSDPGVFRLAISRKITHPYPLLLIGNIGPMG